MNIRQILSLIAAFSLAACDSGSEPAATSPPPPASVMVVDSANAKPAARVAYRSSRESMGAGDLVGGSGIAAAPPGELSKPGLKGRISGGIAQLAGNIPIIPVVTPCTVGGTQTLSGDIADPLTLTLTSGDAINIEYDNCDNGLGEVVDGRMEMTISVFSGDLLLGMYLLDVDVNLVNFSVATGADTLLSNGDAAVSINTTGLPTFLLAVTGNSLTTVTNTSTETLSNYSTSQSVDTSIALAPYTQDSSGTIDSTQLSGAISYSTPVAFQGQGVAYPFAGELLVVGANNASIRLVAIDAVNVQLQIDIDGDGEVDSTEDTTWDDIANGS